MATLLLLRVVCNNVCHSNISKTALDCCCNGGSVAFSFSLSITKQSCKLWNVLRWWKDDLQFKSFRVFYDWQKERSHTTSRAKGGGGVRECVTMHLKEIGKCLTWGGEVVQNPWKSRDVECERPQIYSGASAYVAIFLYPSRTKTDIKKIKDSVSRQYFLLFTRNIFILPSRSRLEIRNGRNGTIGFKPR